MAKESAILAWYDERAPRILDLVGDYAGKGLFVVDGDSLLRTAFSDDKIDFKGKIPRHRPLLEYLHFEGVAATRGKRCLLGD